MSHLQNRFYKLLSRDNSSAPMKSSKISTLIARLQILTKPEVFIARLQILTKPEVFIMYCLLGISALHKKGKTGVRKTGNHRTKLYLFLERTCAKPPSTVYSFISVFNVKNFSKNILSIKIFVTFQFLTRRTFSY